MRIVYSKEEPIDRSDPGLEALRLVNRRKGARHMTAGVATFSPGSAVFLHTHPCEETVIILEGRATADLSLPRSTARSFSSASMTLPLCRRWCLTAFATRAGQPMVIAYFYPEVDVSRDPVNSGQ